MKRTKTLLAIFFLGLLGIADASYLTVLKATDEIRGSVQSEMCSAISETGCRIALESPASSLFGFPVSLLAIVTYLIVAGMALRIWLGGPRREFWTDSLKLVALGAVAYSLTLAGYSQLKNSWCPFCIGLYGINTLLLIASASLPGRFRAAFGSVFGNRRGLAVALTLFVVGNAAALGIFRYTVTRLSGDVRARAVARVAEGFDMGVFPMILAGAPAKGRADAPLTVIEFADMECPHCAKQWFALQELVKKHPDRFRVVFRNNPLSNLCQPMMSTPGHKNACRAAIAGQCAYRQGRFWELGDLLFGNQRKLSAEDIQGYAEEVGLDLKAFETCIEAPEVKAQIRHDALFARKVGMAGTPSNLINGLLFPGGLSVTGAELIGTAVLDRLSQSTPPPNRMWTRHEAMLAEVPEPVPPAAGAFRTEAFRAGASRTESSGAEPQPPFELVMVTDPADPSARPLLFSQYRFAQLHVATTRVGLRVRSEPTCQGEVLADNDACRMERLLACALAEEKGGFVAVQLAKIGKDGPGPRLQQLIDSDEAIRACVIGKRGGALLAADAQAIGDAPVGRAWFAGHRFDHTDVLELDRFLAAMLLQRDAASAR